MRLKFGVQNPRSRNCRSSAEEGECSVDGGGVPVDGDVYVAAQHREYEDCEEDAMMAMSIMQLLMVKF